MTRPVLAFDQTLGFSQVLVFLVFCDEHRRLIERLNFADRTFGPAVNAVESCILFLEPPLLLPFQFPEQFPFFLFLEMQLLA